MIGVLLAGCSPPPPPPPPEDAVCRDAFLPAPGPLAAEAARATDPLALARVRLREARLTADPGFYTLADLAARCRLAREPGDDDALALHAGVLVQFHRFAEAEDLLAELAPRTERWEHWAYLGDARIDRGDLDGAAAAWEHAADLRPGPLLADRQAELAWSRGDLDAAVGLEEEAFAAAPGGEPEVFAWIAARLGWYRFLAGQRPNELVVAVRAAPEAVSAQLLLSRWLVATGRGPEALPHLDRAGTTIEALRLRREIDPTTDVGRARAQDRRGWAVELATSDPAAAVALLDQELAERRDAATRIDRAWAAHRLDPVDPAPRAEVADALATGILEPEVLLRAAEVDPSPGVAARLARVEHALLPSDRARWGTLRASVAGLGSPVGSVGEESGGRR